MAGYGHTTPTNTQLQCFKTRLCHFNLNHKCTRGDNCFFAHSEGEIRKIPDLSKTKLCVKWKRGICLQGNKCNYAHGREELKNFDTRSEYYAPEMNYSACGDYSQKHDDKDAFNKLYGELGIYEDQDWKQHENNKQCDIAMRKRENKKKMNAPGGFNATRCLYVQSVDKTNSSWAHIVNRRKPDYSETSSFRSPVECHVCSNQAVLDERLSETFASGSPVDASAQEFRYNGEDLESLYTKQYSVEVTEHSEKQKMFESCANQHAYEEDKYLDKMRNLRAYNCSSEATTMTQSTFVATDDQDDKDFVVNSIVKGNNSNNNQEIVKPDREYVEWEDHQVMIPTAMGMPVYLLTEDGYLIGDNIRWGYVPCVTCPIIVNEESDTQNMDYLVPSINLDNSCICYTNHRFEMKSEDYIVAGSLQSEAPKKKHFKSNYLAIINDMNCTIEDLQKVSQEKYED